MSSETRRGSRSEDRSKEKRIKDSKCSNSASSENGTRSRSRNPCSKDKRNRSNRARKNKSSSQSIDGTSGSSPDCRKRSDRDGGSRSRDYRNGLRAMHQENVNRGGGGGGGGGGGFRKRRPSPGQLNWSRDQYDKRRQMSSRGHFQGMPRFDRQERFRNNSFNRFRDRNWQNRQNFRFNDRNRDRFQDRNNDRARRNRTAQLNEEPPVTDAAGKNPRETSVWATESPERKKEKPAQPKLEESAAPLSPHLIRSNRSNSPLKKKKINRSRSSSTSSSSSDTSTSSSSTSSSSSSSTSSSSSSSSERDKKRKKKKKLSKKAKKAEKKRREKKKKLKKKQKKKMIKAAKEKKLQVEKKSSKDRLIKDVSVELAEKSKSMAPMTKEEWDKRQNVIRRVFDEETGRHRLVKGDGEILEEIVTKERHKEINRQATRGDGEYFQSRLRTNK